MKKYKQPINTGKDTHHQPLGKGKQKHNYIPPQFSRVVKNRHSIRIGKDVEPLEVSYTNGGNVKWYNYFETQFGNVLKGQISIYHVTHPFHS